MLMSEKNLCPTEGKKITLPQNGSHDSVLHPTLLLTLEISAKSLWKLYLGETELEDKNVI